MKQHLLISLVIVLLGAGYGGYEFFIVFQGDELPVLEGKFKVLEADLAKKKTELAQLQQFSKNKEQVRKELGELQAQLESVLEYLPRTYQLEGLLRKLSMLASNSGVEISSFKPKKGETKAGVGFYSTQSIEFDLRGSFTQTLVFFDQLTRLKRIVNVDSMKIKPADANPTRGGTMSSITQASIKTYRFSE